MANDREVLREIWDGKIPVCFTLNSEEICDLQGPDPFYLMVPRLSYFPLCTEKVRKHFIRHIQSDSKQEHEMWLEFNGMPLKWHYPIGVLLDIYFNDIQLPWNIVVHFDKFPENVLMHCQNKKNFYVIAWCGDLFAYLTVKLATDQGVAVSDEQYPMSVQFYRCSHSKAVRSLDIALPLTATPLWEVVEAHFLSCIKEADVLKHRGQIVSSMQKKDHTQLWNGIMNDKFDQFWSVNGRLMEASTEEGFKYIPFRCYTSEDKYIQRLVKPMNEEGQRKTLKHLLNEVFPDQENVTVRTHGIIPPFETPLQWMSEHLSYPDNFLHLIVVTS